MPLGTVLAEDKGGISAELVADEGLLIAVETKLDVGENG